MNVKLINNTLTTEESAEVADELINLKIHHLAMKSFSNQERFGEDKSNSAKRIEELRKERKKLRDYFAENENAEFEVLCEIKLKKK